MNRSWTFGKKIATGFVLAFVLMAMIGIVAYRSINTLAHTSQMVAHTHLVQSGKKSSNADAVEKSQSTY